jgi:hypothetical protein
MTQQAHTLAATPAGETGPEGEIRWHSRVKQYLDISNLLRLCGGGFTIAAILIFLFQRWEDASDLYRFGMIFGETLILTFLGLATSHWLKDQKSARVFLGLSLISTSAVFTIVAAMLHSQVQWMPTMANLPVFAVWAIDSMETVMLLFVGSLVILGGQSLLALSVLARPVRRSLGLLMLLNTGLLLLPVRHMGITLLLVLPALVFGFHYIKQLRKSTLAMRTAEGTMAGLLVMLPLFIMIGRGAYLYADGPVAIGSLSMLAYLLLRQIAVSISDMGRVRKLLEVGSLIPAALTTFQLLDLLNRVFPQLHHWLVFFAGIFMSGFLIDLALRSASDRERYLQAVFYIGLLVAILEEVIYPGVSSAMLGFVLSGCVMFMGYISNSKNLLGLSLLALIGSLLLLIGNVIITINAGTWVSLAILGMSTIVLAATVERYGIKIKEMMQRLT